MKPSLHLDLGRETSDKEIDEIILAFSPYFEVSYDRRIVRLSDDWLPVIVNFTVTAIAGGVLFESLKRALNALGSKWQANRMKREIVVVMRITNETYVVTAERIFRKGIDIDLHFDSVEELVEYLERENEMEP
jgi:hypothetical protein